VVRWDHSGNASNPIQHFAWELSAPPVPDPATGGWRAGVGEDFPNGGGGRAFLFTIENPGGPVSFFVNNSASAFDLDKPIIVDGVNYGAPLANLAVADAGLTRRAGRNPEGGDPVRGGRRPPAARTKPRLGGGGLPLAGAHAPCEHSFEPKSVHPASCRKTPYRTRNAGCPAYPLVRQVTSAVCSLGHASTSAHSSRLAGFTLAHQAA
jgi:hypothetical protein